MEVSPEAPVKIFGLPMEGFNMGTLLNSWLVMLVVVVLCWVVARSLTKLPGRLQVGFEMFAQFFERVCVNTLGPEHGRQYTPFVGTIFLFVVISNMLGSLPNVFQWLGWEGFMSPTQDLNTPLALAILVMFVVHISAVKVKGFRGWLWDFFEPSFPAERRAARVVGYVSLLGALAANYFAITGYLGSFGEMSTGARAAAGALCALLFAVTVLVALFSFQLGRVPNVLMAPLNFVGELGKGISHPFRLYGNIFGGFVILAVISHLSMYIGYPPILWFLYGFFGIFVGVVQAFVFAMLALAYIAVAISD